MLLDAALSRHLHTPSNIHSTALPFMSAVLRKTLSAWYYYSESFGAVIRCKHLYILGIFKHSLTTCNIVGIYLLALRNNHSYITDCHLFYATLLLPTLCKDILENAKYNLLHTLLV